MIKGVTYWVLAERATGDYIVGGSFHDGELAQLEADRLNLTNPKPEYRVVAAGTATYQETYENKT